MKTITAFFGGLAFCALIACSTAASATTVIVNGTDDIFAAGLGAAPASVSGGGTLPSFINVVAGETLTISATGLVNCCDTSGTPGVIGPDGFLTNPFGGSGSTITNSTGSSVGTYVDPTGAFSLAGVFLGGSSATPFKIGGSDTVIVPVGATELFFGIPDAQGFNGPSGFYSDNSGAFTVTVSAAPEPGVWLLLLAGVGAVGLALRQAKKMPEAGSTNAAAT